MTWLDLAVALGIAAGLLVLPGLPASAAAGLRGFWMLGAAVPLSVTVVTMAALIAPRAGLDWSLVPVAVTAVILAAAAGACRFALRRWWDLGTMRVGAEWITAGGALLAGTVLLVRLTGALGSPTNVSQTYDAIFHLNAVRWVLDTADASPANVADLNSDTSVFYPAGFHGVAALATRLSGAEVTVGVNATWLAVAVVAWPLSILALTRALAGSSRAALLGAGAVAAAIPAFPMLLTSYGVLYPLLAAYAILPGVLAMAVRALGLGADDDRGSGLNLGWLLVTTATVPGVALMHPTALAALLAFLTPWVLIAAVGYVRRSRGLAVRTFWCAAALSWVAAVVFALQVLRPPPPARNWSPLGTMAQALGELATLAVEHGSIALLASVLVWWGAASVATGTWSLERRLAVFATPAVVTVLYLVVAGVRKGELRDAVTASFYNNSPRVSALLCIAVVPLAALGVGRLWRLLGDRGPVRDLVGAPGRRGVAVAVLGLTVLTVGLQGRALAKGLDDVEGAYAATDTSRVLSSDERILLDRLDDVVPPDAVVAGNPRTGTSLAYAIADRPVLYTHILMDVTPDMRIIADGLGSARPGNEVCAAAERLGVQYLLDFGPREVFTSRSSYSNYSGFRFPAFSSALDLVDREGSAELYELVGCE